MKREFNEALAELVEFATVSGNRLTTEQVKLYFKDIIEDESKYDFIYKYLIGLKIEIDGISLNNQSEENSEEYQQETKTESEEAKAFFDMYVSEVNDINRVDNNIIENIEKMKAGDNKAREELTNYYLPKVIEIAKEYEKGSMTKSDIVAEGNLALFEANISYNGAAETEAYEKYLDEKIRKAIETAMYQEMGLDRTSKRVADKLNTLDEVTTNLAKEHGREATLQEICDRMSISEDEAKELMKMSINALSVDEGN